MSRQQGRKPEKLKVGPVTARATRPRGPAGPKDGRWYWRAEVWKGRGKQSETLWTGWASRKEALTAVSGAIAKLGDVASPERTIRADEVRTVRDLMECWAASVQDRKAAGSLSPATCESYRICARRLVGSMGDVTMQRMDLATLEQYRDDRLRCGGAASTIDLELRVLRVAWKWGQDRGVGPGRALPRFRVKGPPTRNKRTPTPAELAAVLDHLHGWPLLATRLLAATGAWVGEIGALKWEAVDMERGEVLLNGKTGPRHIPLTEEVVALLTEWKARPDADPLRVLGVAKTTVSCSLRDVYLRRACKAAGVPRFTPHGLRRHAVDTLIRAGIDVGTAAALLGHSPEVMLRVYRKATMGDMRDALRRAGLGRLPQGKVVTFPGA